MPARPRRSWPRSTASRRRACWSTMRRASSMTASTTSPLEGWDAHLGVNLRAPALLSQAFAARVGGRGGLIVNLLDAKLAAPNPDFFSYTVSKIGLAGLTELLRARLRAGRIRVCGIAPSVTLVSGPQSREQFRRRCTGSTRSGRGVDVAEIVGALALHHRDPEPDRPDHHARRRPAFPRRLPRDVQFLEPKCVILNIASLDGLVPAQLAPEDAQDRARGLSPAGRYRLPRFRDRQSAAAAVTVEVWVDEALLRRPTTTRPAPGTMISCAPRSARSPTARRFNLQETLVARDLRSGRGAARRHRAARVDAQARHLSRLRRRRRRARVLLDASAAAGCARRAPSRSSISAIIGL